MLAPVLGALGQRKLALVSSSLECLGGALDAVGESGVPFDRQRLGDGVDAGRGREPDRRPVMDVLTNLVFVPHESKA